MGLKKYNKKKYNMKKKCFMSKSMYIFKYDSFDGYQRFAEYSQTMIRSRDLDKEQIGADIGLMWTWPTVRETFQQMYGFRENDIWG